MHKPLTDWFKETLGSKVEKAVVSNRLLETPAIIVSSQYGWSTSMERIMKAQTMGNNDRASAMVSLKTLVEADSKDQEAKDIASTLFDVALVGTGLTPADPADFAARLQVLMRLGLGVSKDAAIEEPEVEIEEEKKPEEEEKKEEETKEEAKEEPKEDAKEL